MNTFETLQHYLNENTGKGTLRTDVSESILAIAAACITVSEHIARGRLAGELAREHGDNSDGDTQKALDIIANDYLLDKLRGAPVACVVSEELEEPLRLRDDAQLLVAMDPLDGSSNIETNTAVGTIFSLLPTPEETQYDIDDVVLQPGNNQLAAGYCIYGQHTALVLSIGCGTHIFTLDPQQRQFLLTASHVQIAETTQEFAINVSNFRHWDVPVRSYIDDCLDGEEGQRGSNYNMRWLASLVAECHRILMRGGIFLYPADARPGYSSGRLRLLYECNPIAFLIEQANGGATTGTQRILDIQPQKIHQRAPLIFGSRRETRRIEKYHEGNDYAGARSQLFSKRGLFRI